VSLTDTEYNMTDTELKYVQNVASAYDTKETDDDGLMISVCLAYVH